MNREGEAWETIGEVVLVIRPHLAPSVLMNADKVKRLLKGSFSNSCYFKNQSIYTADVILSEALCASEESPREATPQKRSKVTPALRGDSRREPTASRRA